MPSLPTIDVSCFATGVAPSAAQDAAARLLDETCREAGFFLITGHGVLPEVKARMLAESALFFAEPLASKNTIAIARSPYHRGYVGIATEALDESQKGDLKETLDTGGEAGPNHPEVLAGTPFFGPNQWPSTPGFRTAWEAYYAQAKEAAYRVQRAMARALGQPDDFIVDQPGETMYHLRFVHYPPQSITPLAENQLGSGVHTDYGSVTLLADDGVGGLQVMKRSGEWIDVQVPPQALVVNIGDLMAIWTNDRWISNPHRVVNPAFQDRYSIPLFVTPPYHTDIACLDTCLPPGELPKYPVQKAGDYLNKRISATHSYRNPLLDGR